MHHVCVYRAQIISVLSLFYLQPCEVVNQCKETENKCANNKLSA